MRRQSEGSIAAALRDSIDTGPVGEQYLDDISVAGRGRQVERQVARSVVLLCGGGIEMRRR